MHNCKCSKCKRGVPKYEVGDVLKTHEGDLFKVESIMTHITETGATILYLDRDHVSYLEDEIKQKWLEDKSNKKEVS